MVVTVVLSVERVVVGALFRCVRACFSINCGVVPLEKRVVEDGGKGVAIVAAGFYRIGAGLRGYGSRGRGAGEDAVGDVTLG